MSLRTLAAYAATIAGLALPFAPYAADAPTTTELMQIIEAQQQQLDALSGNKPEAGASRTHIGGYGELHYNNLSRDDGSRDREIDFHRFVLLIGHEFSDRIRFNSEFEIEHALAGDGKPGEVEVEQAYIEFDLRPGQYARGGLFLLPVGIMNETHEPPSFYGVERNAVENIIIPATWWAGGAMYGARFDSGLAVDLAVHEGLAVDVTDFRIRSGRQKTAEASASDLAYTARVSYTGIPGLSLVASAQYQSDLSQVENDGLSDALLLSAHTVVQKGMFGLRALYAQWQLNGTAAANANADTQDGWYLEPSIKLIESVGLYARYEVLDGARDQDRFEQTEIGMNYWPHADVVLKADLRMRKHDLASEQGRDFDGFDLGIGYQF